MMTQNFSPSPILAVWMVLIAFLCGMILPSVAIANMEMAIATEGDPGDGLERDGAAGGGGSGQEAQKDIIISQWNPTPFFSIDSNLQKGVSPIDFPQMDQFFVPYLLDGHFIWLQFINLDSGVYRRGRN